MTADELRTKLTTENPGKTAAEIETLFQAAKKAEPQLNVRAFTSIGAVYGGGYSAKMYANPTVSINVVKGSHNNDAALANGNTPKLHLPYPAHAKGEIGAIGNVFGGGNLATVYGNATVNIGTETTIDFITEPTHLGTGAYTTGTGTPKYTGVTVEGANITGNVYGGGNLADIGYLADDTKENDPNSIYCNTDVNICAKKSGNSYTSVAEGSSKVTIGGDVYGGGKGEATTFKCEKAMVVGETNVRVGNGTVNGSIYGGGQLGRVEKNTAVTIGFETGTSKPVIKGSVFGAGSGVNTHGYSALVRGNSTVIVQGDAKVKNSVYGGGETASVGRYNVAQDETEANAHGVAVGMPYELISGGNNTVTIQGNAVVGPDNMTMPNFSGNVFAAGKGVLPQVYDANNKPQRMGKTAMEELSSEEAYHQFIETLALSHDTRVTISDNAFVKGSVYGGSENGRVWQDTYVTIAGGQIGCGKNANAPHGDDVWAANYTPTDATDLECASWDYGKAANATDKYAPYDKFAGTAGYTNSGRQTADDGRTFYGNVFGGGSGYFPYAAGKWLWSAGRVGGDTYVEITGGHVLTSVYGGNELTNVVGTCHVKMTGGTIGVPRTLTQILNHPVTCNLFGAGKGDPRTIFNQQTNVNATDVEVGGTARIYGSGL